MDDDRLISFAFVMGALPPALAPFALSLKYGHSSLLAAATVMALIFSVPMLYLVVALESSGVKGMGVCWRLWRTKSITITHYTVSSGVLH